MKEKGLKIMISGGGTGGHIFPALAIAEEIRSREPRAAILFVGAKGRMEMQKVPEAGYPIRGLWISGIDRKSKWKNILFPLKLTVSLISAFFLLKSFRPHVVVGTGGFASGPLLFAASLLKLPTLIQEQNSLPGITNKWLGRKADRICVAYEETARFFPNDKIAITGNPVRTSLLKLPGKTEARKKLGIKDMPTLLVLGGSLGARSINTAVSGIAGKMTGNNRQLLWQTGTLYYDDIRKEHQNSGELVRIVPFIREMEFAMASADVILSRAGAGTVSELAIAKKAVILVPSPNVAEDHQTKNARSLEERGAAICLTEKELPEKLWPSLSELFDEPERRKELETAIGELAKPNATKQITDEVLKIARWN